MMFYILIGASSFGGLLLISCCFCILKSLKRRVYPEMGEEDWDNEKGNNNFNTGGTEAQPTEEN